MNATVWITGASSGIGEALAYAYAGAGASLVLSARSKDKLEAVKANCKGSGSVWIYPLDVSDFDRCRQVSREVLAETGGVDILINNAGVSQRSLAAETAFEVDQRIMDVNFLGTVALTKAVLPHMLERGRGHLVAISSIAGKLSTPLRTAYAASKHALHGFFDGLRAEVEDRGVSVTLICPGYIRTDVSRNALTATGEKHGKMDAGQSRGMDPDECARRIVRAVKRRKREAYIGGWEIAAIYIKRFFPGLLAYMVKRMNTT